MTRIAIENLPPAEQITCEPIREAATGLDAAKAAELEARRAHTQLEQELPNARDDDAEADAKARAAGKPPLKGRPATKRHQELIEKAEHEKLVSAKLLTESREHLRAVLDEHGDAYLAEVLENVQGFDDMWSTLVLDVARNHRFRSQARALARSLGAPTLAVGAVSLDRRQLGGIEIASGGGDTAHVAVDDVVAALATISKPEPEAEAAPLEHASPVRPGGSPLTRDLPDVRQEQADRALIVTPHPEDRTELMRAAGGD